MGEYATTFWGWFKLGLILAIGLGVYSIYLLIKKWLEKKGLLKYF